MKEGVLKAGELCLGEVVVRPSSLCASCRLAGLGDFSRKEGEGKKYDLSSTSTSGRALTRVDEAKPEIRIRE